MGSSARRLAIVGVFAVLLTLVMVAGPERTPAQSTTTETPVPPTSTAAPPTETATLVPAETATATTAPVDTAIPTEPPAPTATNIPAPPTATVPRTTPTAPTPPISAANHTASISPTQTTVNNWVNFTLANYPPNATVLISWQRNTGSIFEFASTTTNAAGAASGRFRVPAVTGGPNQTIFFVSGEVTKRVT